MKRLLLLVLLARVPKRRWCVLLNRLQLSSHDSLLLLWPFSRSFSCRSLFMLVFLPHQVSCCVMTFELIEILFKMSILFSFTGANNFAAKKKKETACCSSCSNVSIHPSIRINFRATDVLVTPQKTMQLSGPGKTMTPFSSATISRKNTGHGGWDKRRRTTKNMKALSRRRDPNAKPRLEK